jgi:peptide/nickel transport system permease protein
MKLLSRTRSQRRKRLRLRLFLILALALLVLALLAPVLAPNDPNATSSGDMNRPPCAKYPFGTDRYGRCVCSRVLMGARTSVFSTLCLVGATFLFGTLAGMLAGYYGGIPDTVVMRLADVLLSFPQMVLAIAVAGILGGGMLNAMLALGITGWTLYARLARAQVLSLREEAFVQAARLSGCSGPRILLGTLLPNILGPLLVSAASQLGTMMIGIAGLSFLGIGVQEPQAEWGSMISASRAYLQLAPWSVLAPAAAVILTVMLWGCLGDSARDWLDVEGKR